jgi:predicted Zn-dependent protease
MMRSTHSLLAAAFLVLAAAPAQSQVSEQQIERQAERAFQQMRAQIPISRDAAARDYVQCVAASIVAQLDKPFSSLDWEVELFEHPAANAFAMPGGKIGVFTGIFEVAEDQDALAAVLGHEVAHVIGRHALKRARKQLRNQLLVGVAAGAIGGGRGTANALSLGAELGLGLPYDRKQEAEADTVGLELMSKAGFDPRASIRLWKNMADKNRAAPPQFLSTHPSNDARLDGMIGQLVPSLVRFNAAHGEGRSPRCR